MVAIKEWYKRVNAVWPQATPTLTAEEAIRAAKKLYRYETGQKLTIPIETTSGNRYTWSRHGTLYVNPEQGWGRFVHNMSHWIHSRTQPGDKPHSRDHAHIELRLRKIVLRRGWLDGALKKKPVDPKPPVDEREAKIQKRIAQVARLERKIKALTTRLKTAKRSLGALERAAVRKNEENTDIAST